MLVSAPTAKAITTDESDDMTELRLFRTWHNDNRNIWHKDTLQFRQVYSDHSSGEIRYSEWIDVPFVDENASNNTGDGE